MGKEPIMERQEISCLFLVWPFQVWLSPMLDRAYEARIL